MSHRYQAIAWTPFKYRYDLILVLAAVTFVAVFTLLGGYFYPQATVETLLIRSLGAAAFLFLQLTLSIGPLCRLNPAWLPVLYNRRHLGVFTFVLAAAHGGFSILHFHALGDANPLVSLLEANPRWDSLSQFPFQPLGLVALVILLLMAATSHDFWLSVLTPSGWKRLHMLVYPAYSLVVLHVALGVVQVEPSPVYPAVLTLSVVLLLALHLAAGWKEWKVDRQQLPAGPDGFVDFCCFSDIPDQRARIGLVAGERVAVFRDGDELTAVSNLCPHQNGPLGEGAIIDGLITCPWHGFQFRLQDGSAPPPFTDRVPTYDVALRQDRVFVRRRPNPLGSASGFFREHCSEAPSGDRRVLTEGAS